MVQVFGKALRGAVMALALGVGISAGQMANAQTGDQPSGKIDWGLWIDGDGCMHWYADGGFEGYMVPRRNPETGRPVCLKRHACMVDASDDLFDGATLTAAGEVRLRKFFEAEDAQAFAIYAHTDGKGGKAAERLTQAQADAVAAVAKAAGAQVTGAVGGGARYPKVANGSAVNRRVEVVCYR